MGCVAYFPGETGKWSTGGSVELHQEVGTYTFFHENGEFAGVHLGQVAAGNIVVWNHGEGVDQQLRIWIEQKGECEIQDLKREGQASVKYEASDSFPRSFVNTESARKAQDDLFNTGDALLLQAGREAQSLELINNGMCSPCLVGCAKMVAQCLPLITSIPDLKSTRAKIGPNFLAIYLKD